MATLSVPEVRPEAVTVIKPPRGPLPFGRVVLYIVLVIGGIIMIHGDDERCRAAILGQRLRESPQFADEPVELARCLEITLVIALVRPVVCLAERDIHRARLERAHGVLRRIANERVE